MIRSAFPTPTRARLTLHALTALSRCLGKSLFPGGAPARTRLFGKQWVRGGTGKTGSPLRTTGSLPRCLIGSPLFSPRSLHRGLGLLLGFGTASFLTLAVVTRPDLVS